MKNYDLVIVGGGASGLACSLGAYEKGIRSILILEKESSLGGILNQCIHNGFGLHTFKEELTGPEYAQRFIDMVSLCNKDKKVIEYELNSMVLQITKNLEVYYSNDKTGYTCVKAKAIVMATGCSERTRGNIATPGSRVQGVLTAGLAQKYLNIDGYLVGKKVFILGSGDIGLIMARRMVLEGCEVVGVAEIMPYSNGLNRNIVQCLNDYNIPLYLHHTVSKIIGKERLEKIVLTEVDDNLNYIPNTSREFEVDTLLLSVGLIPYNPLLNQLEAKISIKTKGPEVDSNYQTSIPGIFACGNSLHVHDLVDYASSEGKLAGEKAADYILNMNKKLDSNKENQVVDLIAGNGINYVLPSKAYLDNEKISLKFRVKKPFDNSYIVIKNNDEIIKKVLKPYLLPAEMVNINIDLKDFKPGKVLVEVYENA